MEDCIFCKIVRGELPATKVYEDEDTLAFLDINPVAPVHLLLIPKRHIRSLNDVEEADQQLLGKMMGLVPQLAAKHGCADGFRTIVNTEAKGGQEVFHIHIHVIGDKNGLPAMLRYN